MLSNVVVMFLRMAGSTFDPAPWMTNLKAWSIVSLEEGNKHETLLRTLQNKIHANSIRVCE